MSLIFCRYFFDQNRRIGRESNKNGINRRLCVRRRSGNIKVDFQLRNRTHMNHKLPKKLKQIHKRMKKCDDVRLTGPKV